MALTITCTTCGKPKQGAHVCADRLLTSYCGNWAASSQVKMASDAKFLSFTDLSMGAREIWDFALYNFLFYHTPDNTAAKKKSLAQMVGTMSVKEYAKKPTTERYAIVDQLWNAIVSWVVPDKTAAQMFDPVGDPDHEPSSTIVTQSFNTLGIGFRCEPVKEHDRISKNGFQPVYVTTGIAEMLGHKIRGTVMEKKCALGNLGIWKKNDDAIGQTAICVGRGTLGATKFPDLDYVGDVYLYAVKPSKKAYDTEAWQKSQGKGKIWRSGEKLYSSVSATDIIGYVRVTKHGNDGTNWYITVVDRQWTFLRGDPAERQFLNNELANLSPGTKLTLAKTQFDWNSP